MNNKWFLVGGYNSKFNNYVNSDTAVIITKNLKGFEFKKIVESAKKGQTIFIEPKVKIDLSDLHLPNGAGQIFIKKPIKIASNRGVNNSAGALIFSKTFRKMVFKGQPTEIERNKEKPHIVIQSNDVEITGLRIFGANNPADLSNYDRNLNDNYQDGIEIRDSNNVRFHNCFLHGWMGRGLIINNRKCDNKDIVHVYHNTIASNINALLPKKNYGYGIGLVEGYAKIYFNRFTNNRHDIAGQGVSNCSYEAGFNLIQSDAYRHHLDMHGHNDGYHDHCGSPKGAGTRILIHRNHFEPSTRNHIYVRGEPREFCRIEYNSSKSGIKNRSKRNRMAFRRNSLTSKVYNIPPGSNTGTRIENPEVFLNSGDRAKVNVIAPFKKGVFLGFDDGLIIYSPDCNNILGGNTRVVYANKYVAKFIVPLKKGAITVFPKSASYYNVDGSNLGSGKEVYSRQSISVDAIIPFKSGMITAFSNKSAYYNSDGQNIGSGPLVNKNKRYRVLAMTPYKNGVITSFDNGATYYNDNFSRNKELGAGHVVHKPNRPQKIIKMIPHKNGVISIFSNNKMTLSSNGFNLLNAHQIMAPGSPKVRAIMSYKGGVLVSFDNGLFFSPDLKNLRGGGRTQQLFSDKMYKF